jgi:YgiT-type zinc finger domain-containing protein
MNQKKCNFCGSSRYETKRIEYLYSHERKYLLVPDMPVEVCLDCGMIYYDAAMLKEVERRFFAILSGDEQPDRTIEIPEKAIAR